MNSSLGRTFNRYNGAHLERYVVDKSTADYSVRFYIRTEIVPEPLSRLLCDLRIQSQPPSNDDGRLDEVLWSHKHSHPLDEVI